MSMKTNTRQVDGVTIVDLSGRITLGEGSVVLRDVSENSVVVGNPARFLRHTRTAPARPGQAMPLNSESRA